MESEEFHSEQPGSLTRVGKRVGVQGAKRDPAESCMGAVDVANIYLSVYRPS